jgi:MYXO-CTERM domain-containing protein
VICILIEKHTASNTDPTIALVSKGKSGPNFKGFWAALGLAAAWLILNSSYGIS